MKHWIITKKHIYNIQTTVFTVQEEGMEGTIHGANTSGPEFILYV